MTMHLDKQKKTIYFIDCVIFLRRKRERVEAYVIYDRISSEHNVFIAIFSIVFRIRYINVSEVQFCQAAL